ncbi:MAG: prephenate dehydratase [Candidatus Helarchaeota archaeon]|nr:prephenate dehydratase [Candidatus Helarchaeota archaeon]
MTNAEKELEVLRAEVTKLDNSVIKLLDARAELAKKIGALKRQLGLSLIDHVREQIVYENAISQSISYLTKSQVHAIYKEIIAACRAIQTGKKRISTLGPAGTFAEQAAKMFFSEAEAEFYIVDNINTIFRQVVGGEVEYGVVPVENTTHGSVALTLDLLLETDLTVSGEIILRVKHNLIALKKIPFSEVKTILSHEQAIGQCRQFIEENLPDAEIVETKSTAQAVELLAEYPNSVAIGTEMAAELYSRKIIAKDIEDNPNNYTRFFVIGHQPTHPTGSDKTSIVFSVRHAPGTLLAALQAFSSRNINLTKLESRPSRLTPWEYYFYTDFEGHVSDPNVQEALKALKENTLYIKVLGSYPKFSG